jgi:predicted RNA-binding protein YlxR (DUF448 family)
VLAVDGPSCGRGAWLCREDDDRPGVVVATCLERALSQRRFGRAWRVQLGHDDVEAIRAALRRDEQPTD